MPQPEIHAPQSKRIAASAKIQGATGADLDKILGYVKVMYIVRIVLTVTALAIGTLLAIFNNTLALSVGTINVNGVEVSNLSLNVGTLLILVGILMVMFGFKADDFVYKKK